MLTKKVEELNQKVLTILNKDLEFSYVVKAVEQKDADNTTQKTGKQNLVVVMEPTEDAPVICLKGGKMYFNRFLICEDAAFELFGVHYLAKSFFDLKFREDFEAERKSKGKEIFVSK